jgi:hypothetical protein
MRNNVEDEKFDAEMILMKNTRQLNCAKAAMDLAMSMDLKS